MSDADVCRWADVHLVFPTDALKYWHMYPINMLRNIANQLVLTQWTFVLDADLLPNAPAVEFHRQMTQADEHNATAADRPALTTLLAQEQQVRVATFHALASLVGVGAKRSLRSTPQTPLHCNHSSKQHQRAAPASSNTKRSASRQQWKGLPDREEFRKKIK